MALAWLLAVPLALVALVDAASHGLRHWLTR